MDNGATDSSGDTCIWYDQNHRYCGDYDDDDLMQENYAVLANQMVILRLLFSLENNKHFDQKFQKANCYSIKVNSNQSILSSKLFMYKRSLWPDLPSFSDRKRS